METHARNRRFAACGFTLLELLIVLVIIVILISITLAVGSAALASGRSAQTQGVIRSLDQLLDATLADSESPQLPTLIANPLDERLLLPMADARNFSSPNSAWPNGEREIINSLGLFLVHAERVAGSREVIDELNLPTITRYTATAYRASVDESIAQPGEAPPLLTPLDAWDRPIRFVHPAFSGDLGQGSGNARLDSVRVEDLVGPPGSLRYSIEEIRRKTVRRTGEEGGMAEESNDADGGTPVNQRPYFYSLGEDGLAGFGFDSSGNTSRLTTNYNLDNVYTDLPTFVQERDVVSDDLKRR